MDALKFATLFCLAVIISVEYASACGPKPCSWRTCHASYAPHYGPNPRNGHCVRQVRRVHHRYVTHRGKGRCPPSRGCGQRDLVRTLCACPHYTCKQGAFGAWKVLSATQEYRERHVSKHIRFYHRGPPCPGMPAHCNAAREYRPRAVRCPRVPPVNYGVLVGESCAGGASSYKHSKCHLLCNSGKRLVGSNQITCLPGNKWSGSLGRCALN